MDFGRLRALSKEVDILNAIINGEEGVSFASLFEGEEGLNNEFKLDKLCQLTYKIFKSMKLENEQTLLNMYTEIYPEAVGKFCIAFIKMHIDFGGDNINEKLNILLSLDYKPVPSCRVKADYFQLVLNLLLCQEPLNLELINRYNNELKELLKEDK